MRGNARLEARSDLFEQVLLNIFPLILHIKFSQSFRGQLTLSDSSGRRPRSDADCGPGRRSEIVYSYRVRSWLNRRNLAESKLKTSIGWVRLVRM